MMPNFIKNLFSNRDEKKEVITVEEVKETKNELVNTVDEKPKEQTEYTATQPNEETVDSNSEQKKLSEVNVDANTDTKQYHQEDSNVKKEEVKDSSNEDNANENSGEDNKPDTQSPKTDETEPPNRGESNYEKDRYVKQVEGEYLNQLTELAKQASKQILNEAVDTIIENLMYPKILKNLDDAFVELSIKQKVDDLIEERVNAYLSERINALLPEIVNTKLQESVPQIIEAYCKGQFAEKFDEEIRKYLNQHQVSLDYLDNYKNLYIDISKLVKLIDDINLEEGKQTELENLLNNMLAKVLFQRERWIKKEKEKKLMGDEENENKDKEES